GASTTARSTSGAPTPRGRSRTGPSDRTAACADSHKSLRLSLRSAHGFRAPPEQTRHTVAAPPATRRIRVRPIRGIAVTAALALGALALAGAATATGNGTRAYEFVGTVQAVDVPGNHVSVAVSGGNRAALRAMIGQPATETFTVGPGTRFAWWGSVRFAP